MEPENKIEYSEPKDLQPVPDTDVLTVSGSIPTVTSAPTHTPVRFADQFRIVNSGGYKLYVYDTSSNTWKYVSLS